MQVKMRLLLALAALLALTGAIAAPQGETSRDVFVGLWQGVWSPTNDFRGFGAVRSITVNDDGSYTIHGDYSDLTMGVLIGKGVVDEGVLLVDDMVLNTGTEFIGMPTQYRFDAKNGTLLEELYHPDTGITHQSILHKTSR